LSVSAFVLDASAAIAWASPDEAAPPAIEDAVVSGSAVVPSLWLFEIHNVLHMLRRRKRLLGEDWDAADQAIRAIGVEFESLDRERIEHRTCALAQEHDLTVYDAAYLELAQRRRLPLATLDDDLRRAAKKARVKLV
jgi:predicted nucleic acid-binding protein